MAVEHVTTDADSIYARPAYRAYALVLLTTAYIFNYIDRKIIFIVQEPIKLEFGLSDAELGLMTGFTFMLFYVIFGIPFARWADRGVRRDIIAFAIAAWSAMTILCGMTQTFMQLMLARIGVAVGEAGGTPPAHSMISDIYPLEQRGKAMSIYSTGVFLGVLFAFAAGGWISQHFGWRMAFVVVGVPGILLALLVRFTLKEPRRGMADKAVQVEAAPPMLDVMKMLWSKRSFRYMVLGATMSAFFANSMIGWMPSFLMRSHAMSIAEVGAWLALILGIVGGTGTLLSGYLADKLGTRDRRWYIFVPAAAMVIALPFTLYTFTAGDYRSSLVAYCVPVLMSGMFAGPIFAMTHALVAPRSRAMATAVLFLVQNMLGMGLAPLLVGICSDLLGPAYGKESLRYALLLTLTISTVTSFAFYYLASKYLRADLDAVKA